MRLRTACAFLRVAVEEGKNVRELTNDADVGELAMSRDLLDLGPITRPGDLGLRLVEHRTSLTDRRIHELYLTE